MKILFITPHLSAGGMPQFLLKKIQLLKDKHKIAVFEWNDYGRYFPIQRNAILAECVDFYFCASDAGNESKDFALDDCILKFKPDIIHFEELPETFCDTPLIKGLFESKKYITICSTHGSHKHNIKYVPDLFVWPSEFCIQMYPQFPNFKVWEYPIENNLNKKASKVNIHTTHVAQVGLWSAHKNQGYTLQLAEALKMMDVRFLFAGNMASNFENYWKQYVEKAKSMRNVIVEGECDRDKIDLIYRHTDILIMPSTMELNPISVKEALGYGCRVLISNIPNLPSWYKTHPNVFFLEGDLIKDVSLLLKVSELPPVTEFVGLKEYDINDIYENVVKLENKMVPAVSPQSQDTLENTQNPFNTVSRKNRELQISATFMDRPRVTIKNGSGEYEVRFIDENQNKILHHQYIQNEGVCEVFYTYYIKWHICVLKNGKVIWDYFLDLQNKRVFVSIESSSLGDNIAWLDSVNAFQKATKCELILSTFYNYLFDKSNYPNIKFVEPKDMVYDLFAHYRLGVFDADNRYIHPNHPFIIPLTSVASERLGFNFKLEIRPKLILKKNPIKNHIVICARSTAGSKEWQRKNGWKDLIFMLAKEDYSIDIIYKRPDADLKKERESLERILSDLNISTEEYNEISDRVKFVFNVPLTDAVAAISQASLFIGLPSGLSWVAWALEVPVIMISGFSHAYTEFDCIRVQNTSVCNGCWNNPNYRFDKTWWWCPKHAGTERQFECTKHIEPISVFNEVVKILP